MDEKIKVIFEDNDLIIIDKPGGLVVTNEGRRSKEKTLEDWLRDRGADCLLPRFGIVHRLDKGTSGLMIVAKNLKSLEYLKKQFKDRTVKKKYLALICGDLPREGGMKVPIGRSRFGFGKFGVDPDGKKAETKFRLFSKYKKGGKVYSLVDIDLMTGRTHQIRVHFSNLRWPLLGDKLYGGEKVWINRPFLHSYRISFVHPDGKTIQFESELPTDLKSVLSEYEKEN